VFEHPRRGRRGPASTTPKRGICRRWFALAATLALFLPGQSGVAQIRDRTQHGDQQPPVSQASPKKSRRGPRAIAVVEFLPGGGTRLVPVALWIDNRFYDASLYGANPQPMALEPDTVYEATNYGEPVGLFTVTTPEELKGSWIAQGKWSPRRPLDEQLAQQAAKQPKPKPAGNVDDERPILRRPGSGASSSTPATGNSAGQGASAPPGVAGQASPVDSDSGRPTLKKPPESSAPPAQTAAAGHAPSSAASPDENDPNRPVLRRGKPASQAAATEPDIAPTVPTATRAEAAQPNLVSTRTKSYAAVSDAGPYETRSLLYAMNSAEQTGKSEQMRSLALEEIRKFMATRNAPALPKNVTIAHYDLRAYDLDYSNSPTLVLTATLPVVSARAPGGSEFDYFVTVVAREDINGTPIKIFSSVTDSNHLDAYPRLEIVDAVDADANGRGDLLFRQYSDTGISYSLFRVYPYDMKKVFEGGSGV